MPLKFNKKKQKGILPVVAALIIAGVCILILVLIFVLIAMFGHIVAGLSGGGDQPNGGCNVGCGFDTSKIDLYTKGDSGGITDAVNQEAKNFAVNTLKVDSSQITAFDKSQVENMIRAEVAKQWSVLSSDQQHGATQTDAQHAILAYQYHEDSSFQMFVNSGGRLVPKHDGTTIQLLSISKDKYEGNKRKEIALNWDIKYTIYTGVNENMDAFQNHASGAGADRWKQAIAYVFLPGSPNCYWTNAGSPCRSGAAEEGWNKFQNETAYSCQTVSSCSAVSGSGPCGQNLVNIATNEIGQEERKPCGHKLRNCVKYNNYSGEAWCDTFVNWVYKQAGFDYMYKNCFQYLVCSQDYFRKNQIFIDVSKDASQVRPGDYVWIRADSNNSGWHVGIAESYAGGQKINTIEGNVGDGVVRRKVQTAGTGDREVRYVGRLKSCNL